jgi:hypothetical protein
MLEPADLVGTWQFARDGAPAFLHFTYTQALDFLVDGETRQILRLWYALEEPNLLRFRNRQGDQGWTCSVEVKGPTLIITGAESKIVCTRAEAQSVPEWFVRELAASHPVPEDHSFSIKLAPPSIPTPSSLPD